MGEIEQFSPRVFQEKFPAEFLQLCSSLFLRISTWRRTKGSETPEDKGWKPSPVVFGSLPTTPLGGRKEPHKTLVEPFFFKKRVGKTTKNMNKAGPKWKKDQGFGGWKVHLHWGRRFRLWWIHQAHGNINQTLKFGPPVLALKPFLSAGWKPCLKQLKRVIHQPTFTRWRGILDSMVQPCTLPRW